MSGCQGTHTPREKPGRTSGPRIRQTSQSSPILLGEYEKPQNEPIFTPRRRPGPSPRQGGAVVSYGNRNPPIFAPNDIGDFIVLMISLFWQVGKGTEGIARGEFARLGILVILTGKVASYFLASGSRESDLQDVESAGVSIYDFDFRFQGDLT